MNPELMVEVSSMGKKVLAWTHAVVVGQVELPGSSGPGVVEKEAVAVGAEVIVAVGGEFNEVIKT